MQYSQYRFKFYFNASHAIYLSGEMGQSHPHTWEVVLCVMKISDSFVLFNEIEKMCEDFLGGYQDVFINTVQPFTTLNPTLENICNYFKKKIQEMLSEKGWLLLSIELSETPSRAYMISVSDELEVSKSNYDSLADESMQELIDKLAQDKIQAITDASVQENDNKEAAPLTPKKTKQKKAKKEKKTKTEKNNEKHLFHGLFNKGKKGNTGE